MVWDIATITNNAIKSNCDSSFFKSFPQADAGEWKVYESSTLCKYTYFHGFEDWRGNENLLGKIRVVCCLLFSFAYRYTYLLTEWEAQNTKSFCNLTWI